MIRYEIDPLLSELLELNQEQANEIVWAVACDYVKDVGAPESLLKLGIVCNWFKRRFKNDDKFLLDAITYDMELEQWAFRLPGGRLLHPVSKEFAHDLYRGLHENSLRQKWSVSSFFNVVTRRISSRSDG